MMTTLRALVIAFSMYSQIPMPQFTWQDKEMKYAFCFFPWVGAAIGGITMFWWWFCGKFSVGNVAFAMIGTAIPLAVTGGFHVDGFRLSTVFANASVNSSASSLVAKCTTSSERFPSAKSCRRLVAEASELEIPLESGTMIEAAMISMTAAKTIEIPIDR